MMVFLDLLLKCGTIAQRPCETHTQHTDTCSSPMNTICLSFSLSLSVFLSPSLSLSFFHSLSLSLSLCLTSPPPTPVEVDRDISIARLMQRSKTAPGGGLTEEQARQRVEAQLTNQQRRAARGVTHVFDNNPSCCTSSESLSSSETASAVPSALEEDVLSALRTVCPAQGT